MIFNVSCILVVILLKAIVKFTSSDTTLGGKPSRYRVHCVVSSSMHEHQFRIDEHGKSATLIGPYIPSFQSNHSPASYLGEQVPAGDVSALTICTTLPH